MIRTEAQVAALETAGLLGGGSQSAIKIIVLTAPRLLTDAQATSLLAACPNVTTFVAHTWLSAGSLSSSVKTVVLGRTSAASLSKLLSGTSAETLFVGVVESVADAADDDTLGEAFGSMRTIRIGGLWQEHSEYWHKPERVLERHKEAVWTALRHARSVEVLELSGAYWTDLETLMVKRGEMPSLKELRLPYLNSGTKYWDDMRKHSMTADKLGTGYMRFPPSVRKLEIKNQWAGLIDDDNNSLAPIEQLERLVTDLRRVGSNREPLAMPKLTRVRHEIVGSVWEPDEHDFTTRFNELAAVAKKRDFKLSRKIKFCASLALDSALT